MSAPHLLTELAASAHRCSATVALAALVVAAGARSDSLVRLSDGAGGIAIGLLVGGHIVLREPARGTCLVDIVSPAGVLPNWALESSPAGCVSAAGPRPVTSARRLMLKENPDHLDADLLPAIYDLRREPVLRSHATLTCDFWLRNADEACGVPPDHPQPAVATGR
jgi:hypothetical protein